ncbi:MAG: signal peptidase I [Pseudomonadota bacterium]|nr:signal peptidase I [Pseudomonadota bacterium]
MTTARPARGRKAEKSGVLHETWEVVKTIAIALLVALVLRVFLFQPFTIPSASMEPTLLEGDYIIVSKYAYGYSRHSAPFSPPIMEGRVLFKEPERGDIVVFKLPRDGRTDYIKRLVGLPGDRIQVQEGRLFINGRPVDRRELEPGTTTSSSPFDLSQATDRVEERFSNGRRFITQDLSPEGGADNTGVYVVPEGCYFMMGDNRDNSVDSRFAPDLPGSPASNLCGGWNHALDEQIAPGTGVGFVPAENLVGKAELILFSWNAEASLFQPWTWFTEVRPSRFFTRLR